MQTQYVAFSERNDNLYWSGKELKELRIRKLEDAKLFYYNNSMVKI